MGTGRRLPDGRVVLQPLGFDSLALLGSLDILNVLDSADRRHIMKMSGRRHLVSRSPEQSSGLWLLETWRLSPNFPQMLETAVA